MALALAIAWGEKVADKAIFAIAAALITDKVPLLEVFHHEYGVWKWIIEHGWRVDKAMEKKDLTDPLYRAAALQARWERHVAQRSLRKPIDAGE